VGNVGNAGQKVPELFIESFDLLIERRNLAADGAHLRLPRGGIRALAPQLRDFGGFGVAPGLQPFGLGDGGAPLPIELAEAVETGNVAAGGEALRDPVEVAPEVREIVHVPPC